MEFELDDPQTLTVFDNGNTRRLFPNATANNRGQVWKLDEANHKAALLVNADLGVYSAAFGAAQKLADGNYHFLSGFLSGSARSIGVNPDGTLNFILQSQALTYRSFRMRDLYTSPSASLAGTGEDQTISFDTVAGKTYGDAPFAVSATGGASGNPITFDSQTPATCSVSDGAVTILGAGTCTVRASQAGDSNYSAGANVARSFQIAQAATATAVTSSDNPAGVGQGVAYTATVTSAAGAVTGVVRFLADGALYGPTGIPCVAGVGNSCTAELRASSLPAGKHTITAEYLGNANFFASAGTLAGGQVVVVGGVFQFAQPVYSVGERGGSVTVRVLRNGDTSLPVSVDYTTDDGSTPSVFVPCSARTGAALERCDYGRALGTLRFAAGLREQTFNVLVNDDSFVEGAETATLRLSNPAGGAALAPVSTATLEITDDAPESAGTPIDDDEAFVAQHYRDFLNRAPDPEGLKFWTDGLKACGSDQQCREVKRVDISAAFFLSIEFQETGYLVERMYKTAYGDATSPNVPGTVPVVRLNEFLAETQRVGQGVIVNSPGWEQRLADNKQAYALEFVQRPGLTNIFLSTLTAEEFVTKLDRNAGGVLSDAEKTQLISALGPAPGDASKRAAVLRQVAESAVLRQRETDRAFVLMQFYGYLRRNPDDAPEKDLNFAGWKFWLDKLESFGGDYRRAEMVKAFITSDEYRQRFSQ